MIKDGKLIDNRRFRRRFNEPNRLPLNFLNSLRHWFFRSSLIILILLSGILVWEKSGDPKLFPVKHIKITGNLSYVDRITLQQVILPFINKGFLRLDSRGLKDRLLQQPWVNTVTIRRFWPDILAVNFSTKKPVAFVDKNNLLDEHGNIFSAGRIELSSLDLPLLVSPLGQQKYLLHAYQTIQPFISNLKLKIKLLKLVDQQYWYLKLNNGIALYLNRMGLELQLERFVEVYPDVISDKAAMIDYVDLRYAHGMALKFKQKL